MTSVDDMAPALAAAPAGASQAGIQPGGYLFELSRDWIVLRASENIHRLIGQSHVALIDEPLGRFTQAQALHDLRNLFSRLSGTTGIARAFGVRLTEDHDRVDIAFQLVDGRVLLEAVPSPSGHFGEAFGTVGGLIAGLGGSGQALLDAAARRMRALTGYDRATLFCGDRIAESSRGGFAERTTRSAALPAIVCDCSAVPVGVYPPADEDSALGSALLRCAEKNDSERLERCGVRARLSVPFVTPELSGEFVCDNLAPRKPSLEIHAAAELFAQMFALNLEIDRLN